MKKLVTWMLVLIMVFAFAACGEDKAADKGAGAATPEEVTGEVYDAGNVQALAPDGWKAFGSVDVFAEEEGAMDPDVVTVCKGGETDMDLFSKPYVRIDYYGADTEMMEPSKDFYDNVVDMEPLTTGSHTWNGFTCDSFGVATAILWTEEGEHQYQASLVLKGSNGDTISLDDVDVQAILASVVPSAK